MIKNNVASKLLKFQGRLMCLARKAAFKHRMLGSMLVFNRHDWHVETTTELKMHIIPYL